MNLFVVLIETNSHSLRVPRLVILSIRLSRPPRRPQVTGLCMLYNINRERGVPEFWMKPEDAGQPQGSGRNGYLEVMDSSIELSRTIA